MDMPFSVGVCYCDTCREKYFQKTGREIPEKLDFRTEESREFQGMREKWLTDFVEMMRDTVKKVRPATTVEQNISPITLPWYAAITDAVAETSDYAGGDLYGGYLEQS